MSTASPARSGEWVLGRVGGAPVVVAPTSLLLGLLIAASWYPVVSSVLSPSGTFIVLGTVVGTVLGVAASILAHELAHGLSGTLLGRRPVRYELHLLGGRTSFGPTNAWAPWRDVVTSLAGPATNALIWAGTNRLLDSVVLPVPMWVAVWAISWVNLALAIFNALPGLPLDGGHALASLIAQVTGRRRLGEQVAAWGGLLVVAGMAWLWVLRPLVLDGQQPSTFNLILVIMVGWSIGSTCWGVLGLGRGTRAAAALDLRDLARPVAAVNTAMPVARVRELLESGTALVLVSQAGQVLGAIDAIDLDTLGLADETAATAGQVCTVVPAAAFSTQLTGQGAAAALKRARGVSRWLVLLEAGRLTGAVPTGAR